MATISRLNLLFRRLFSSVLTRFVMLIAVTVSILLVLMNTTLLTADRDMIFTSKKSLLQNQASIIASSLTAADDLSLDTVTGIMKLLDVTDITGISVRGIKGDIYYDSISQALGFSNNHDIRMLTALSGSTGFYGHFHDGAFICYYYMPLVMNGQVKGVLILYELDTDQGAILLNLQKSIRLITVVVTLIFILIAIILVYTISYRLNKIRRGIQPVGEGDYTYRIGMKGSDEFSELATAFDGLAARLEKNEAIRRRFVADASHELKTPIASIRLLSDSILQTESIDPETTREFVGDIGNEAERLANITEHLLTLTRLDNSASISRSPCDLSETAAQIVHSLLPLASARSISLEYTKGDPCYVLAGKDELSCIVQNLAENAIKYNVDGGRVSLSVTAHSGFVRLTVADTGIGIPEDEMTRIFDRFYRVDKARSREQGGTGLGLSIVKDTVAILGGSIEVARAEGGGSVFTVLLPPASEAAEL